MELVYKKNKHKTTYGYIDVIEFFINDKIIDNIVCYYTKYNNKKDDYDLVFYDIDENGDTRGFNSKLFHNLERVLNYLKEYLIKHDTKD